MFILINENNEVIKCSLIEAGIEVENNYDVLINPEKFLYINNQLVLKENANSPLFNVSWNHPEKTMRIYISDYDNSRLSIDYPEFGLWFKEQENPIDKIENGCIVYLNTITDVTMNNQIIPLQQIQQILTAYNTTIETNGISDNN